MNEMACTGGAVLPSISNGEGGHQGLLWLRLLQERIDKFTKGDSSSIPMETAGILLRSILYTAALAQNVGDDKTPEALYREGRDILSRQLKKAWRLSYLVKSTMLQVDAPCYREAVTFGIPGFFKAYDMDFAAQETPGDFDYPVSIASAQTGVAWMLHFLETLYWENVFCSRFPPREVEGTLRAHGIWGVAIPVNVFEPVFAAALSGCLLGKRQRSSLAVHAQDNQRLLRLLSPLQPEAVLLCVREACDKLMEDMQVKSDAFRALLISQAYALATRLIPALLHGDVSGVFPPVHSPPPPVVLMDGDPMEGEVFQNLCGELSSLRYFSDKLMLVRRRVHSLYDLTGLMESGGFKEQEMARMFSMLGQEELAALLRMGRGCMMMKGRWIFPERSALPEDAPKWEKCLYGHLHGLGPARRKEIADIAGQMQMTI